MTQNAVPLTIMRRLFMLENNLTILNVELEGLAHKLEFSREDIIVQLQEVKDFLYKVRITMDAAQGWMEKKGDQELDACQNSSS